MNDYLELLERKPSTEQSSKTSKKNWFDRSIMAVSYVVPENNDDVILEGNEPGREP